MAKWIDRKQFAELCADETNRAARYKRTFSVLTLTLDYKQGEDVRRLLSVSVNQQFARFLREVMRDLDSVSRFPGEVFAVAMPETDPKGAMLAAERVRQATELRSFVGDASHPTVQLVANVGTASFPEHGQTGEDLIGLAQSRMLP